MDYIKLGTEFVTVSSVLHAVLPPWEGLNDFPTFQKYYKLFIYFIGYFALNARSTLYPSIATQNGSQQSLASQSNPNIVNK